MQTQITFNEFPKMARLSREMIITEKIDGTNASIFIQDAANEADGWKNDPTILMEAGDADKILTIRAGSRTRWITPENDNYGFAKWVLANAIELFTLGEGHHFGEWWGSGIQRGYGLEKGDKRFSLFNVHRWNDENVRPDCCGVVPTLWTGNFDTDAASGMIKYLTMNGSEAAPGYMKPEGIVIYHTAANICFKKTIEKDETPKSLCNK